MELEVFSYIEEFLNYFNSRKEYIEAMAKDLDSFFTDLMRQNEEFTNVSVRVKSEDSIKEKIIRENYFFKHSTPQDLFSNLKDTIGARIECRFIRDEDILYRKLDEIFNKHSFDDYYYSEFSDKILLEKSKQPQVQNNGFKIYRIDGKYLRDDFACNFELQIKSYVNVFWGDIEHKVLYKNYTYMLREDITREILYSIKDNLNLVDSQLLIIYNYLQELNSPDLESSTSQLQSLISKTVHDIFVAEFRKQTGIAVDFRKQIDLLIGYLFAKVEYEREKETKEYFLELMEMVEKVRLEGIVFGEFIQIGDLSCIKNKNTLNLAKGIESIMNLETKWNMFFTTLFALTPQDNTDVYIQFIDYIYFRIIDSIRRPARELDLSKESIDYLVDEFARDVIDFHFSEYDIDLFSENNFTIIGKSTINTVKNWDGNSDLKDYRKNFRQRIQRRVNL